MSDYQAERDIKRDINEGVRWYLADTNRGIKKMMTEAEREELIEKMARRIDDFINDTTDWRKVLAVEIARNLFIDKKDFDTLDHGAKEYFLTQARAALAVAEPVIREECARIAENFGNDVSASKYVSSFSGKCVISAALDIAAAIREGGKDE